MRVAFRLLAAATGVTLLAAACGGDNPTPTDTNSPAATPTATATSIPEPSQGEIALSIESFTLPDLTVEAGATLAWTNLDGAPHTVTSGAPGNESGEFDSDTLSRGDTFRQSFGQAGSFAYFCSIHPSMTATIMVTASGATAAASGATATAGFTGVY
jgi:plastocyanin